MLPEGMAMTVLRALLLTDVVDSTGLAATLGDERMSVLWSAHDRAARDLLVEWRGQEIDKSDGLLLVFENAADGAGYARAYHRALATLEVPLAARAGLHVAHITLRRNPEADVARGAAPVTVDGIAKSVAARLMSAAVGGQTLMTAEARLALGVTLLRVQSHGHWRLKGLPEAVELFEVGDAASPFVPPPDSEKAYRVVRQGDLWQPLRRIEHNLPAERDRFIGREEPLRAIAAKLESGSRLVSVLGTGGTGKTRLAIRFAWTWLGAFPGGVWFCDLSQASTLEGIYYEVAQALDVPLGKTDPRVQLADAIAGRGRCLVIFDNFEQVARHAEESVGGWLDRAPQASFLVTTREVLNVAGEHTLPLGPMPTGEATALFLRRIEGISRDYPPSGDETEVIGQLVKVLDGLPLAIELAAARVRIMSPRTLLSRMNERFKLLLSTGGRRDRQATLRATFDWSWDLLTLAERWALAQLSVFEGGFTLASAEGVVDLSRVEGAPWMLDVLQGLVDKSFVRRLDDDRFDLLDSVRDYAGEHLRTAGRFDGSGPETARSAQLRHCRYFAGFDDRAATAENGIELNNLVAACRRAVELGDEVAAVGTLSAAWHGLQLRGPFQVAMQLVQSVEAMAGLGERALAIVDWVAASTLDSLGKRSAARRKIESGLARARSQKDAPLEGRFLCRLAEQIAAKDSVAALKLLDDAQAIGERRWRRRAGRPGAGEQGQHLPGARAGRRSRARTTSGAGGRASMRRRAPAGGAAGQHRHPAFRRRAERRGGRRLQAMPGDPRANRRIDAGKATCIATSGCCTSSASDPMRHGESSKPPSRSRAHGTCTARMHGLVQPRDRSRGSRRTGRREGRLRGGGSARGRAGGPAFGRPVPGLSRPAPGEERHVEAGLACLGTGERLLLEASDEWSLGLLLADGPRQNITRVA
jgi:predicted ATPase/class 3 adenylate cyclase